MFIRGSYDQIIRMYEFHNFFLTAVANNGPSDIQH